MYLDFNNSEINPFGTVNYGFFIFPFLLFADYRPESYLQTLNKSEYEAVMRCMDQFESIKDIKRFVRGLRG